MAYGLQVFNDSNYLQIADTHPVMQVLKTGTITSWTNSGDAYTATISSSGMTLPSNGLWQVWVRPSSSADITGVTSGTSAIWWSNAAGGLVINGHQTINMDYIVCGEPRFLDSPPAGNYGLEVYNASAQLIFTSNLPIWKTSKIILNYVTDSMGTGGGYTIESSTNWSNISYGLVSQCFRTSKTEGFNAAGHTWSTSVNLHFAGPGIWFRKISSTFYHSIKYTWHFNTGNTFAGARDVDNNGRMYFFAGVPGL